MQRKLKVMLLTAASGGALFAGTCDAIAATLFAVSDIVFAWV